MCWIAHVHDKRARSDDQTMSMVPRVGGEDTKLTRESGSVQFESNVE